jgi:hypothetical protein
MPRLILIFVAALSLAACPDPTPPADAGGEGEGEGELDAGPSPDAGDEADGGVDADAGVDAGADAGDAGFVCSFPDFTAPPPDAGRPDCTLENVEGTGLFEGTWEGQVFGEIALAGPFDLPAAGEMSFEIYCGEDKLLVDGLLEGVAYEDPDNPPDGGAGGFPFSGRMFGEFELATGLIRILVDPATLQVGPFNGTFRVSMGGQRVNDDFDEGTWCGETTNPVGGEGGGAWRAEIVR